MDALLRTKHWIWFVLLTAGPIFAAFFFMRDFFSFAMEAAKHSKINDVEQFQADFFANVFPKMKWIALTSLPLYLWLFSVNIGLRKYHTESFKPNPQKFYLAFFLFTALHISVILLMGNISGNTREIMERMELINLLQLPFLASTIWLFFITAKTIKSCELQREAKIDDYAVNSLLVFFLFVGVWIIQPKLNKIANGENVQKEP